MVKSRDGLKRSLELALEAETVRERPRWDRLREWLEANDNDADVVVALYEAEYDALPFPEDAEQAIELLARYMPFSDLGRQPGEPTPGLGTGSMTDRVSSDPVISGRPAAPDPPAGPDH